ncbi:hypothetical protein [Nakamurella multipartita]|uniref:hypothetical protein n=1 Tax=Nakamurella multipartita TaxID=53461 RepID=UPI00145F9B97|nr:hypothetical protein [Nakamurella multipartita]
MTSRKPSAGVNPRVKQVQLLRRSGAAGPHASKVRRNRGHDRRRAIDRSSRGE